MNARGYVWAAVCLLLVLLLSAFIPAPPAYREVGKAAYYAPGVMQQVVRTRLYYGHITPEQVQQAHGFVARLDCREIGTFLWIDFGQGFEGPFLVVDCAAPQDRGHIQAREIIVEVAYEEAVEHGFVAQGLTKVVVERRYEKEW